MKAIIYLLALFAINALAGDLPDSTLTPGLADSTKTQDIICAKGYTTKSVRPPASYTTKLKHQQLASGYKENDPYAEEDHLISLELGGDPRNPLNLWPQPWNSPTGNGAKKKDALENRLHKLVCTGQMTLLQAQSCISTNWILCYERIMK